jgi:alpha-amylase/alpha-mannosidase (GH57 family)
MDRFVCIHGHFYQPPRENPWLEAIEAQDSAYPYHDWNERITAECYAPNARARILDGENRIVEIVNNYQSMSFNFGPTLLSWLDAKRPDVYSAILEADRASAARFSGHGSAIAQPYNHTILPLANARDRAMQVKWGIRDFERRFGRLPEGMWLPETAVDVASLEALAAAGIRFTILAPHQVTHIRTIRTPTPVPGEDEEPWREIPAEGIDPTRPYRVHLPSGAAISVFFFDGPVSRAVAFDPVLLSRGDHFAERLVGAFDPTRGHPELVHVASDGETYGHHHRHGDMALAYALRTIEQGGKANLTNYGEFLEAHPPTEEVQILESSSWSCAHGVERWRSDCGCSTNAHPGWNQAWRGPLREALDGLRDALEPLSESAGRELFADAAAAREGYIDVILDRSPENVARFFGRHALRALDDAARTRALKLLELVRHAQLMYTSCGWFFDDIGGLEGRQILQYAGKALDLARDLFPDAALEGPFLETLSRAKSNVPEAGDGRQVYDDSVGPARVSLERVAAHYAVHSLFTEYADRASVYAYRVEREDSRRLASGRARLALGRVRVTSAITGESKRVVFGVLHLGDHNLSGGVTPFTTEADYDALVEEISEPFTAADLTETLRLVDRRFGSDVYTLRLLFRDEQRQVVRIILASALEHADDVYRRLYEEHAPLMRFLSGHGVRLPRGFAVAAERALATGFKQALAEPRPEVGRMRALLDEAGRVGVTLHDDGLGLALQDTLSRLSGRLSAKPDDAETIDAFAGVATLARALPFEIDFGKAQNAYYELARRVLPVMRRSAEAGSASAAQWVERFRSLGEKLAVRIDGGADVPEPDETTHSR